MRFSNAKALNELEEHKKEHSERVNGFNYKRLNCVNFSTATTPQVPSCFNPWEILAPPFINIFLILAPCLFPLILPGLLLIKYMPTCTSLQTFLLSFFIPIMLSLDTTILFYFFAQFCHDSLLQVFILLHARKSKNCNKKIKFKAAIWTRYRPCS